MKLTERIKSLFSRAKKPEPEPITITIPRPSSIKPIVLSSPNYLFDLINIEEAQKDGTLSLTRPSARKRSIEVQEVLDEVRAKFEKEHGNLIILNAGVPVKLGGMNSTRDDFQKFLQDQVDSQDERIAEQEKEVHLEEEKERREAAQARQIELDAERAELANQPTFGMF